MIDFIELARQCAPTVAPETLAAIVKTESKFQPFAIGLNSNARLERQPNSKLEAVATAKWLIANGYDVDLGLGQINSSNLTRTSLSVEDAFDSCKNLAAAAQILTGNYLAAVPRVGHGQQALRAAISTYNTGSPTRGFANGYVQRVVANGNVILTGTVQSLPVLPIRLVPENSRTSNIAATSMATPTPVRLLAERSTPAPVKVSIKTDSSSKTAGAISTVSVYEYTAHTIDVYQ